MAMTKSDKDLLAEKFGDLHRLLDVKFDSIDEKMATMIKKQEITNGRVNKLEDNMILNGEQHKALADVLIDIKNTLSDYKKKNIGFWLYFSEKPMRLITLGSILTGAVFALAQINI